MEQQNYYSYYQYYYSRYCYARYYALHCFVPPSGLCSLCLVNPVMILPADSDDGLMPSNGRVNTPLDDMLHKVSAIRAYGIKTLNLDLMYGFDGQSTLMLDNLYVRIIAEGGLHKFSQWLSLDKCRNIPCNNECEACKYLITELTPLLYN